MKKFKRGDGMVEACITILLVVLLMGGMRACANHYNIPLLSKEDDYSSSTETEQEASNNDYTFTINKEYSFHVNESTDTYYIFSKETKEKIMVNKLVYKQFKEGEISLTKLLKLVKGE